MCCEHSHRCRPMSTTSFFAVVPTSICASNLRRGPPTNNKQQGGPMKGCFRADMTDSKGFFFDFWCYRNEPPSFRIKSETNLSQWQLGLCILRHWKIHPNHHEVAIEGRQQRISKFCQNVFLQMSSHPKHQSVTLSDSLQKKQTLTFFPCSFTTRDFEIVSFSFKLVWNSRLFSGLFPQFIQEESIWMRKKTLTRNHK